MRSLFVCSALLGALSCTTSDVQRQAIGSACAADSSCGTGKYFCDTDHPDGYCSATCHKNADCPSGSVCAGAQSRSPGGCHKSCTATSDCRQDQGYECVMSPPDATGPYCDHDEMGDGGP
jgi:hypothetical protein